MIREGAGMLLEAVLGLYPQYIVQGISIRENERTDGIGYDIKLPFGTGGQGMLVAPSALEGTHDGVAQREGVVHHIFRTFEHHARTGVLEAHQQEGVTLADILVHRAILQAGDADGVATTFGYRGIVSHSVFIVDGFQFREVPQDVGATPAGVFILNLLFGQVVAGAEALEGLRYRCLGKQKS